MSQTWARKINSTSFRVALSDPGNFPRLIMDHTVKQPLESSTMLKVDGAHHVSLLLLQNFVPLLNTFSAKVNKRGSLWHCGLIHFLLQVSSFMLELVRLAVHCDRFFVPSFVNMLVA